MLATPEQVRNVWAGDAVWFNGPVGNLRRPHWWCYVMLAAAVALLVLSVLLPAGFGKFNLSAVVFGAIGSVFLIGAEALAAVNRFLASRILRRKRVRTLGGFAARCWLAPIVCGTGSRNIDAAAWLHQSGVNGPRLLLREVTLPPMAADPTVNEEEPIDTQTERNPNRRKWIWVQLAMFGIGAIFLIPSIIAGGLRGGAGFPVIFYGVTAVFAVSRLGFRPFSIPSMLAAPGRVSCVVRGKVVVFIREDSVMLLEPMGSAADVVVQLVRRDGRAVQVRFSGGPHDPMLKRLLSRWCWRNGAGLDSIDHPLLDADPLPGMVG